MVTQIADGENGGVMMNEFPDAYRQAHRRVRDDSNGTVSMNGSEYICWIQSKGINETEFPAIQAVHQKKLWDAVGKDISTERVTDAIRTLQDNDDNFSMQGASWTNSISWEDGYKDVLDPMNQLSRDFHKTFDAAVENDPNTTSTRQYQQALLHLLVLETSCFRYWGQGQWTEYAREIHRRGDALIKEA